MRFNAIQVEHVAMAVAEEADMVAMESQGIEVVPWCHYDEPTKERCRRIAKAAILAMRMYQ